MLFRSEYVNDTKHEDIEKSIDRIDQDLLNDNGSKSSENGEIIYENSKIENGHNALAHLDREYERIKEGKTVRYADKTNQLSDKAPKEILNPDKFGVGTEVTFVVDDGMQFKVCSTSFTKYFVDVLFPQKIMHVVGNCVVVYSIVD